MTAAGGAADTATPAGTVDTGADTATPPDTGAADMDMPAAAMAAVEAVAIAAAMAVTTVAEDTSSSWLAVEECANHPERPARRSAIGADGCVLERP
jgi:hypothetical protein